MGQSEIDAVPTLLSAKFRPVGGPARRAHLDEVVASWPVADDVDIHAQPMWNAHLEAGRRALATAGAFVRRHL